MKCAENNCESPWPHKVIVNCKWVNIRVKKQPLKHLVVLLLNGVMERCDPSLVLDVDIYNLLTILFIQRNAV